MCSPIAGNFVRPRRDCKVPVLPGSKGLPPKRTTVTVNTAMRGIVHDDEATEPGHSVVIFELENAGVLMTQMSNTMLKGVEL